MDHRDRILLLARFLKLDDIILLPLPIIIDILRRKFKLFSIGMDQLGGELITQHFLLVKALLVSIEILIQLIE
jgi:hypothetical protein